MKNKVNLQAFFILFVSFVLLYFANGFKMEHRHKHRPTNTGPSHAHGRPIPTVNF